MENIKKHKNTILGILALVVGGLLLMDNLNVIDIPVTRYIFSWKTLFLVLGVYVLVVKQKLTGGLILISLGVTLWLPVIFNNQFTLGQIFLPAVLMIAGLLIILNYYLAKGSLVKNQKGSSDSDQSIIEVDSIEVKPAE